MEITFGIHSGKRLELIILKYPDYVSWMLNQKSVMGRLANLKNNALILIDKFDKKPYIKKCFGDKCIKIATRCSVGTNISTQCWWCNKCNPYQLGGGEGQLEIIKSYKEALAYVDTCFGGKKAEYRILIRSIAEAKGLPKRIGNTQAFDFFSN